MKLVLIIGQVLFLFSLSLQAQTLTILNWEEFLSEDVIKDWEEQTGHKIKQVYYDNDEDRDALLIDYDGNEIDIVIADELATQSFGRKGTFLAISELQTQNIQNVDPHWQKLCGNYSVPYLWGTLGIVYRKDKIAPPDSWQIISDPQPKIRGHYGLMEDFIDLLAPALLTHNKSINTESESDLKEAFEGLKLSAKHALTFDYAITFLSSSELADQLYLALAYSGDQYALNEKAGSEVWEYTTLNEGTATWLDCVSVMSSSPRKTVAFDFLNYLFDINTAAKNSEDVYSASPISKAKALQSEEYQNDKTVYPPEHIMKNSQYYTAISSENTLLRNRITASLVKIHESK
mgnify:CR=1 FL=1|tara:strand:- start:11287 stop:12327 length:1041 start_codon:yes stop_codon:yes gene_type:complete